MGGRALRRYLRSPRFCQEESRQDARAGGAFFRRDGSAIRRGRWAAEKNRSAPSFRSGEDPSLPFVGGLLHANSAEAQGDFSFEDCRVLQRALGGWGYSSALWGLLSEALNLGKNGRAQ